MSESPRKRAGEEYAACSDDAEAHDAAALLGCHARIKRAAGSPSLRLGLVCGVLRTPALALAPVQAPLRAYPCASVLSRFAASSQSPLCLGPPGSAGPRAAPLLVLPPHDPLTLGSCGDPAGDA